MGVNFPTSKWEQTRHKRRITYENTMRLLLLNISRIRLNSANGTVLVLRYTLYTNDPIYLKQVYFREEQLLRRQRKANSWNLLPAIFTILFLKTKYSILRFVSFGKNYPLLPLFTLGWSLEAMFSISRFYHGKINHISGKTVLSPFYSTHFPQIYVFP